MNIGFIGFGKFAELRLQLVSKLSNITVAGFYDISNKPEARLPSFDHPDTLLACCDAVFISVPVSFAPHYVTLALSKGVHVFCEKPAAISREQLKTIEPHLGKATLAYGFNHRQHESIRQIKEKLTKGHFGDVLWVRGRYGKEVDRSYCDEWRCDKSVSGGGILMDQGIHIIDLVLFLFGSCKPESAVLSDRFLGVKGVEDNAFLTLVSGAGIPISLHSTVSQWRYIFSLEIFCEFGSLILNGLRTRSGNYGEEILDITPNRVAPEVLQHERQAFLNNISWEREVEEFIEAAKEGRAYKYAGYKEAVEVTGLIEDIYSAATWC